MRADLRPPALEDVERAVPQIARLAGIDPPERGTVEWWEAVVRITDHLGPTHGSLQIQAASALSAARAYATGHPGERDGMELRFDNRGNLVIEPRWQDAG